MRLYQDQPSGTVSDLRALRTQATEAEKHLRRALREALPQHKWRFQAPVGPCRVDFLCVAERLVIEVDGGQHSSEKDAARTRYLKAQGLKVLRFWNNEVLENVQGVLSQITAQLPLPPGEGWGEGERLKNPQTSSPSPSHAAAQRGPLSLPKGEV